MRESAQTTVADAVERAATVLATAGCEPARGDAETIVASALGVDAAWLAEQAGARVSDSARAVIDAHVTRRRQREPLAYITGWCKFRGLKLAVDHRVLVPDELSAPLVEVALKLAWGARVHDAGTGSGALALAIKHERPDLIVSASDVSAAAVEVAVTNATLLRLDVSFQVARGVPAGSYDLVIANLPYLANGQRSFVGEGGEAVAAPPELIDHMPRVAVFAGPDPLDTIRSVLRSVAPGTRVALQHGPSHSTLLRPFFRDPEQFGDATGPARFTLGEVR